MVLRMSTEDGGWGRGNGFAMLLRMALKQNIVLSAWVAATLAFEPFQRVGSTRHG
jgi:hypothetical protein